MAIGIWLALAAPAADATFPGSNGRIVFAKLTPSAGIGSTLWTVDPRTGRTQHLTRLPANCDATIRNPETGESEGWQDMHPAYSPSGRWIAFTHRDSCGPRERRGIYLMRADGSHKQLLVGGRELPAPYPGITTSLGLPVIAFGYPAWSRDGRRLAFLSGVMKGPIRVVQAGPDGPRRVAELPLIGGAEGRISWGPARALAFTRLEGDAPGERPRGEMIVARPDGRGRRRLPPGLAPDWSPDATRLAFNSALLPDADCGAEKYIGPHAAFRGSAYAGMREAAQLVPVDEGCNNEAHAGSIYVMRADGRDLRRVTIGGARLSHDLRHHATWSPDGHQIAFLRTHGQYKVGYAEDPVSTDIYVVPAGGGPIRRVTKGLGAGSAITSLSWQALPRSGSSRRGGVNPLSFFDRILDAAGRLLRNAAESIRGVAEPRAVRQAVHACKQSISGQPRLSSGVKKDLNEVCEEAASRDPDAVREATKRVCKKIIEETAPAGAAKQQGLSSCDQAP